jgi:hypothetical protein
MASYLAKKGARSKQKGYKKWIQKEIETLY